MSLVELKVPAIGESITEVTLSQWLKKDGEYVRLDDPICEFESDKATLEFPSEAAGKLIHIAKSGEDLEIGAVVAHIDTSVSAPDDNSSKKQETDTSDDKNTEKQAVSSDKASYASGHPSPAAEKIIATEGLNPQEIKGSGKDGRITKSDAISAASSKETSKESTQSNPLEKESSLANPAQFSREVRTEKMSRMRKTIARRLVSAKNETAMLTTFNEVDLNELMELRSKVQDRFVAKYGIKLGFMSLFAKACAQVLMEMPEVNAQIDGDNLIYHDYADISIAISTPSGLVVPPVHNVESLGFHEIELKIKNLADKARVGKLSLEEMSGGTFTITNGGVFGSMLSTPIINEPQSAILGMHNIIQRPVAINGEVVIRPMMYIALSYDHRVIDGSSSVTFLVKVKQLLENPNYLLMGL
jgi:2-oxoglutarate dehydrogenase E2 component (dihydrolipoamide succinyltransferase)